MDRQDRNLVEEFFDHKFGVAVTTREEYDSLFRLLRRLNPDITWSSGDDLFGYDAFLVYGEETYITYSDISNGVLFGCTEGTQIDVISYDLFESFVDGYGLKRLTFEEVLFGEESG